MCVASCVLRLRLVVLCLIFTGLMFDFEIVCGAAVRVLLACCFWSRMGLQYAGAWRETVFGSSDRQP